MSGHKRRIECARCGRVISARTGTNEPVTHQCPHGLQCSWPVGHANAGTPHACPECRQKTATAMQEVH